MTRRSIVASTDIRAFEPIEPRMLSFKRPGDGIEPKHFEQVIGMCPRWDIAKDRVLRWDDLMPLVPSCLSGAATGPECGNVASSTQTL